MKKFEIVAINRSRRIAMTDDGTFLPFVKMYSNGEETDNEKEAITAIVQMPSREWYVITLTNYEGVTT